MLFGLQVLFGQETKFLNSHLAGEILMKVNSPQLLDQFGETILSRFLIVFFEEEGETVQRMFLPLVTSLEYSPTR